MSGFDGGNNLKECQTLAQEIIKGFISYVSKQGMRYIQRANKYVEQQDCSKAYEVLIAPKNYCENQIEFKRYITYESVHEFFEGKGLRFEFKGKLLKIGIERLRRGFAVVNSNENQTFWSQYWELVCSEFPELYMKKPNVEIPVGSDWPIVYTILEPKLKFVHKFEQKCVDYSFTRPDNSKMDLIRSLMNENMSFKITKTGNLLLKLESPFINRLIDFSNQKNDLRIGLNNMLKLRTFLIENQLC